MMTTAKTIRLEAPGAFGLGVRIEALAGFEGTPVVVLLHGVHGTSNLEEENKYGKLARLLAGEGINAVLVETGRLRRDPRTFGTDRDAWALSAFEGKSYAMDLYDILSGLETVRRRWNPDRFPLWLWGFSLGGIHAVMIAGGRADEALAEGGLKNPLEGAMPLDGIVLSGSGLRGRKELASGDFFSLPVLDSLPSSEALAAAAAAATVRRAQAFYGSLDGTFSEQACRDLWEPIRAERKGFHVIERADHAFRNVDGVPSDAPLKEMVERLLPI